MPSDEDLRARRPVTRSELVRDLRHLGVDGGVLMIHTRMSALGWVVGGAKTVVRALLEVLGEGGTLMALVEWSDDMYHVDEWPEEWQRAYRAELPPFDPALSESAREMVGRIPERLRTWPGAHRSDHPEASFVAVGPRAEWITVPHPPDDAYAAGTPLARLVEAGGSVLVLGASLETLTLLHYAEAIADVPEKRRVTYRMPVLVDGRREWREFHDFDTSNGAFPYDAAAPPGVDAFEIIGREALAAGCGRSERVADAECHLFEASSLVDFAVTWMEERFKPA